MKEQRVMTNTKQERKDGLVAITLQTDLVILKTLIIHLIKQSLHTKFGEMVGLVKTLWS